MAATASTSSSATASLSSSTTASTVVSATSVAAAVHRLGRRQGRRFAGSRVRWRSLQHRRFRWRRFQWRRFRNRHFLRRRRCGCRCIEIDADGGGCQGQWFLFIEQIVFVLVLGSSRRLSPPSLNRQDQTGRPTAVSENFPGAWLRAYWNGAWCKWNPYIPPASQSRGTTPTEGNPNGVCSDSAARRHPKVVSSIPPWKSSRKTRHSSLTAT